MKVTAVRSDNHLGISSFVFSNTGKGRKQQKLCGILTVSISGSILPLRPIYTKKIFFAEIEKINSVHFLGLYLSSCNELQELSVAAADGCSSMIGESGHHHCHH